MLLRTLLLVSTSIYSAYSCPPTPTARARATIFRARMGAYPNESIGIIDITQSGNQVRFRGTVFTLTPGYHGMHVHAIGDLGNGCLAAGPHFNPFGAPHGGLKGRRNDRHVGDLGNIFANVSLAVVTYYVSHDVGKISNLISRGFFHLFVLSIQFQRNGEAMFDLRTTGASITRGPRDIIGRTIVIHSMQDDLGKENRGESATTGNSGMRVACGLILPR
ncbi:unnamed protein product [Cylicostephanus goldi]|uniref:Superoxide dismutase [Cu-Zn] n=1 Tax=Cylicostephanus goldi TaxID=71465 RepID=A0A3P7LU64_CYLGO|nr:unnamed protein product [Cylicostephanus goldi]